MSAGQTRLSPGASPSRSHWRRPAPRALLLALSTLACLIALSDPASAVQEGQGRVAVRSEWVPGEILVKFKAGVGEASIRSLVAGERGLSVLATSRFSGVKRLRVPKGSERQQAQSMRADPRVAFAEPNYIAHALAMVDDPLYCRQWHLDDACGVDNPYGGENGGGINLESAWQHLNDLGVGWGKGATVAVIDTGVAYEDYHEPYKPDFKIAPDLAQTHFVPGYDFVNNDEHPNDDHGHGTHVTGTIAQSTNNGIGCAGVAPEASIMPVKVLSKTGGGTYAAIADGIYFAADHGADIINLSLGGKDPSQTLEDALQYAYEKGVTIIAAAGNTGNIGRMYPAGYDDYVIAVGATGYNQKRAPYSTHGYWVDIAAPGGVDIPDMNGDGYPDSVLQQTLASAQTAYFEYKYLMGTSMASPHVAGVAALVVSLNRASGRELSPDGVREALESTAEPHGIPDLGAGIVDAGAAVRYVFEKGHDVAVAQVEVPAEATTTRARRSR
jgi:serine protease